MPDQAPGTGWWQGQDGRWYPPQSYPRPVKTAAKGEPDEASGKPGEAKGKPDRKDQKESRAKSVGEWIQTTQGLVALIASIVALAGGGAAIAVNSGSGQASTGSVQNSATPLSTPSAPVNSAPVSAAQLTQALLPTTELGPGTVVTGSGTDLSTATGLCGEQLPSGAQATAYETMKNSNSADQQELNDSVIRWDSASDASNALASAKNTIDQIGSCPMSQNGATANISAIPGGSPPPACSGGQYLAVQGTSDQAAGYIGYRVAASCGAYTVAIAIVGPTSVISQETADGYLTTAVAKLQSTLGS
jgi:hypothetical protein